MRPMLFGKYCLLERVSVGGMAEVFRAKPFNAPPGPERHLALKRILPHLAEDDEFINMFVDEARLCVHLRHPNVVNIFELGQFQSSYYILMEFIAGQDVLALQKRMRRERLIMSVAQACYIIMELAKGLDYAHRARDQYGAPLNIIHRDISPQNILVTYRGGIKLIDFGVAKAAVQSSRTQVGVLKGKFGYMSPEQITGEALDHRSDIFAVGTVLWELLTNRRLFSGENEFEIFQKVRDADVEPPSAKNPQVPPEVDRIVMKALAPKVGERYQWCSELAQDLGQFLRTMDPIYTQQHLSEWMGRFFQAELAEEQGKHRQFSQLRTAQDVRDLLFAGSPSEDGDEPAATKLWDSEVQPGADEAPEEFGENNTRVAAGGFDLNEFLTLDDDDLIEVDEAPPAASQGEVRTQDMAALNAAMLRGPVAGPGPQLQSSMGAMQAQSMMGATLSGVQAHPGQAEGVTAAVLRQARARRNQRAAFAALAVAAALTLTIASLITLTSAPESAASSVPATPGALLLTITPDDEVVVVLDGVSRAAQIQHGTLHLTDLAPGPHALSVSAPGHTPVDHVVEIPAGGFVPLDIQLKPR